MAQFCESISAPYNCTKNDVMVFTPYELMFGRQPRLPVDLAFGLPLKDGDYKSHSQYVQSLKSHLEESYRVATQNAKKTADKNKARFDMHVTPSVLEAGDRVLVRAGRLQGKHKLADKWESDIHVVVRQAGDLPVYTIRPENKDGPLQTVHRELLLPCGFLQANEETPLPKPACKPRTRQSKEPEERSEYSNEEDDVSWSQEQLPKGTTKFTTVYEIPRAHNDSDSTCEIMLQTYITKDTNLPVDSPGSGKLT